MGLNLFLIGIALLFVDRYFWCLSADLALIFCLGDQLQLN
jgi:hypothetical protein